MYSMQQKLQQKKGNKLIPLFLNRINLFEHWCSSQDEPLADIFSLKVVHGVLVDPG
jgi:hypothetical protein